MRLHLISNSHIDPVWLWDQYEGIDEVLNTFRSACDRLDEFPALTFSASSVQFYAWVLEHDRSLFDRITKFVRAGRWEVVGDWWVEADSNLPTGESLRRQTAHGREFTRLHFGKTSEVAFLPDTFGHPADLPRTLRESGFRYLIFCRPNSSEKPDVPDDLFYWNYAGHRVLAYRLRHHYFQEDTTDEQRLARINDPEYTRHTANAFLFGLGDHGGGPTIAEIECFQKFIASCPEGDVGFSSCAAFFAEAELRSDIPEYSGDLHMHAVGCYSVVRDIKQLVRTGEAALLQAERASRMADVEANMDSSWRTLLFNQFHDILPGSMSPDAGDQARYQLGGVLHTATDRTYEALKRISLASPAQIREGEFRAFNTLPYPITIPVAVESFVYFREGAEFLDSDGRSIQIQEVLPDVRCGNRRWVFVDTIPAAGFRSYHFDSDRPLVARASGGHFGDMEVASDTTLVPWTNDLRVRMLVLDDDSDTWSHGVSRFEDEAGEFSIDSNSLASGPVAESILRTARFGNSTAEVEFTRYAGVEGIFVDVKVRWSERRRILKLEFTRQGSTIDSVEMQGGSGPINRPANGTELPLHRWVRTTGKNGFGIVQDGAFACDVSRTALRLTLVRSSFYGYDEKTKLGPLDPQRDTDIGEHHFRIRLLNSDEWDAAALDMAAETLVEKIVVIRETP